MTTRSFTILAALAVAAMFTALPFAATFDSDAYTDGQAGYVTRTSDKITDAEITATGISKNQMLSNPVNTILNAGGFSDETYYWNLTVAGGTYNYEITDGTKIDGKELTTFGSQRTSDINGAKVTVTFYSTTALLADPDYATPKDAQVIEALADFFGTSVAHAGDTLEISFDGSSIAAYKDSVKYADRDSTTCLVTSGRSEMASSDDLEATVTFTPSGGTAKSITVSFSESYSFVTTADYDYGKDLASVNAGDKVTVNWKMKSSSISYSQKVTVDGKTYKVDDLETSGPNSWSESDTADVVNQEYVRVDPSYTAYIDGLTDSDNVKYSKGYDAAESQYDDDFSDASPAKAKNYMPFIVGGIVVLLLAGFVAAMVLVKKKA